MLVSYIIDFFLFVIFREFVLSPQNSKRITRRFTKSRICHFPATSTNIWYGNIGSYEYGRITSAIFPRSRRVPEMFIYRLMPRWGNFYMIYAFRVPYQKLQKWTLMARLQCLAVFMSHPIIPRIIKAVVIRSLTGIDIILNFVLGSVRFLRQGDRQTNSTFNL